MKTLKELKRKIYDAKKEIVNKYKEAVKVFNDKSLSKTEKEEWFTLNTKKDYSTGISELLDRQTESSDWLSHDLNVLKKIIKDFEEEVEVVKDKGLFSGFTAITMESEYESEDRYNLSDFYLEFEYYIIDRYYLNKNRMKRIKNKVISEYLDVKEHNLNCNVISKMMQGKLDIDTAIELMQDCKI